MLARPPSTEQPHQHRQHPSVSVAEVRHRNLTKKVAVYEGMSADECGVLLQAAFVDPAMPGKHDQGKVVGFVHLKTKTFLPLSLATAFPQLIQPNHTYELILEKEPPHEHAAPSGTASAAASSLQRDPQHYPQRVTQSQVASPPPAPSTAPTSRDRHGPSRAAPPPSAHEQDNWSETMYNLLVHWDSHQDSSSLPLEKLEGLLLGQQHPQLHQAFVAYSTPSSATHRDLDALVHQVRRVLAVLAQQTKSSFTRVVNQLPLLKPHDIALIHELFTQGNELVLAAWEVFELEEDKDELADTLLRIVRFKRQQAAPSLESICREMVERDLLTWAQYQGLLALWEAKNDAMVGAVEAFHVDKDMRELVDTLLLVVKHAGLTGGDGHLSPPPPPSQHPSGRGFSQAQQPPQSPDPTAAPSLEELHPLSPKHGAHRGGTFSSQASQPPVPQSPPSYGTFGTLTSPTASLGNPRSARTPLSPSNSNGVDDARALLDSLLRQSLVTQTQHQLLAHVARDEARVHAAVAAYAKSKDVHALAQSLGDLYDVLQWETNHDTILHKWIVPLEGQGKGDGLRSLWASHDPRMMAAYLLFVHDHDEHEFVDTLVRLSVLCSNDEPTQDDGDEDVEAEAREVASSLLALHSAGKLSQDVLETLQVDDPKVLAAFDVFETSQDVNELVDTLNRVAGTTFTGSGEDELNVSGVAGIAGTMEKQLLHFVYELQLPADELAALKQAIADNDTVVQAAVEVYQVDQDEEDFKDTLRRVARHCVGATELVEDE